MASLIVPKEKVGETVQLEVNLGKTNIQVTANADGTYTVTAS